MITDTNETHIVSEQLTRIEALEERVESLSKSLIALMDRSEGKQLGTSWFFDARFPFSCDNLYSAEYQDSKVKRWVGPLPTCTFRPNLLGSRNYVLTVSVFDFISSEQEKNFSIFINGTKANFIRVDQTEYTVLFRVEHDGEQSITLSTNSSRTPRELYNSDDDRALSFSVSGISVVLAS